MLIRKKVSGAATIADKNRRLHNCDSTRVSRGTVFSCFFFVSEFILYNKYNMGLSENVGLIFPMK